MAVLVSWSCKHIVSCFISPFGPTPIVATVPVGPLGTVFLPTPIPPGMPLGIPLFDQWFILT